MTLTPVLRRARLPVGAVAHVVFGPSDGPPLVGLPGLVDGLAPLWLDAIRAAMRPPPRAFSGHRVVVCSYPAPLPEAVGTAELAGALADFLELEVAGPAVVAGHSMGGMVAQHLAASRPDLVRGLVLSATLPAADDVLRTRLERWEALLRSGDTRAFHRDALDASYTGSDLLRRRLALRLMPTHAPDPSLVARHLALSAACRAHDARGVLGDIDRPTLVLAGSDDVLTRVDGARALATAIPGARFEVLRRVGHGFPEQAHRRYSDLLVEFVRGLP